MPSWARLEWTRAYRGRWLFACWRWRRGWTGVVMAMPRRMRRTDLNGVSLLALLNSCSSLAKVSVRAFILLFLFCMGLTLLLCRGGPNAPALPLCIYDRDGLSCRRRDPIIPLLLHPDRTYRARLLVHLDWYRFTHLRCCQGEGNWCSWKGSRWIRMGRGIYTGSRWCCGCGCVWSSCTLRGKGLNKSLELS